MRLPAREAATAADALRAGVAYFAAVFAFAFALGIVRAVAVEPALGEAVAVLVEVPVVLAWAWWVCGRCLRRWRLSTLGQRAGMGAIAFGLLMVAELALAAILAEGGATGFAAGLGRPEGMIGFLGQVAFGLMPLLRRPA